jgi:hypothetical protein
MANFKLYVPQLIVDADPEGICLPMKYSRANEDACRDQVAKIA